MTVQTEGSREAQRSVELYKPDLILAVGYRVRSARGLEFRRWASTVFKEYLEKGFAINDERLKNLGGGNSWKELFDRITQARSTRRPSTRFAEAAVTNVSIEGLSAGTLTDANADSKLMRWFIR